MRGKDTSKNREVGAEIGANDDGFSELLSEEEFEDAQWEGSGGGMMRNDWKGYRLSILRYLSPVIETREYIAK